MLTMLARGEVRAPRARSRRWRSVLPFVALWASAATVAAIRAEVRASRSVATRSTRSESRGTVRDAARNADGNADSYADRNANRGADRRAMGVPFARLFPGADTGLTASTAMRAVVVAQLQDCNGNLGVAAMLSRAAIAPKVPLRAVVIEGSAADTADLRAKLPRSLKRAGIHLLQRNERDALNAMGHHATPLLLLFDSRARLRLVAPVSPDPVEVVAIRRAVTHLASNDPLK